MLRFGFPAGPAVLGLILGPLAEANLRRALITDGWASVFTSPIALVLLAISVAALVLPPLRQRAKRRQKTSADPDEAALVP
jgi:putative tricarboxylic transport membrane protein